MDISQTVWQEADASNSTAAPDGAPEGMNPGGINDTIRADRGAIKRWYNQTIPLLTGGSSTAYTLSYSVTPTALSDGMTHLIRLHAANGAAATLNVNALGAKPIYCYAGAWVAAPLGMLAIDQIVCVSYNVAAGAYFLLDLPYSSAQSPSGVSTLDFMIPAGINHIECFFSLKPSANGVVLGLQAFGAGSVLDTAANYYCTINTGANSATSNTPFTSTLPLLANTVDNGNAGFKGDFSAQSIQAAEFTSFNFRTNYQSGAVAQTVTGSGTHTVAAAITGVRFYIVSGGGTFSGKATLIGRV